MRAKSIYPLKIEDKIVRNPREEMAVSNGWEASDAYSNKPITTKRPTHNIKKGK